MNKAKILNLIKNIGLSPVSINYIDNLLENNTDKDIIDKNKLEIISKIIETESKLNENLAEGCDKLTSDWQELLKGL